MSGIWIESKTFNQDMLEKYEIPVSITALVLFIPFSGIEYIIFTVPSDGKDGSAWCSG